MNKIDSPVDKNSSTIQIEEFETNRIITLYKNMGLDVERFFSTSEIFLYKCKKTGYRFYYPYEIIGDSLFYNNLSKNRKNYYTERWEHKQALDFLNKNDKVLEVGSGFGKFLELLKNNNIIGRGLELNPHAVNNCKTKGLDVEEKLVQDEAYDSISLYDAVCFFQVLEHITDINGFLKSSIELLKPNGKLIIGVPNNNPYLFTSDKWHTLNLPPHHAGLWDKNSLVNLTKVFNLKLESLRFEPLALSYSYFINHKINSTDNFLLKKGLIYARKVAPQLLKYFYCKRINGRNILAVYRKI